MGHLLYCDIAYLFISFYANILDYIVHLTKSKPLGAGKKQFSVTGLLSLSALYRRHTLVVTANKLWSTIEYPTPVNLLELLNECSVKLVYLGQLRFGELKPYPRSPPRPIPIKSSTKKPTAEPAGQSTALTDTKVLLFREKALRNFGYNISFIV